MKSNRLELFKESWHTVYPNKKRKRIKIENSNRYLFYQLLDKLLELGFESKVYVLSSIAFDLCIKQMPSYEGEDNSIEINFIPEKKCFIVKENDVKSGKKLEYGELNLQQVIENIVRITDNWHVAPYLKTE